MLWTGPNPEGLLCTVLNLNVSLCDCHGLRLGDRERLEPQHSWLPSSCSVNHNMAGCCSCRNEYSRGICGTLT